MVDIFLMGTAGSVTDPKRSQWREPIKVLCKQLGVEYYDPTEQGRNWDEKMGQQEIAIMRACKVIVMPITADTAGVASLAESGWAAASAFKRGQVFGLYISPVFEDRKMGPVQRLGSKIDRLLGYQYDSLEAASRRARMLALGHATAFADQFPNADFFIATDIQHLISWIGGKLRTLQSSRTGKGGIEV